MEKAIYIERTNMDIRNQNYSSLTSLQQNSAKNVEAKKPSNIEENEALADKSAQDAKTSKQEQIKKAFSGISGKQLSTMYMMQFSQKSFDLSFSQSMGQINAFNKADDLTAKLMGIDFTKESSVQDVFKLIKTPEDAKQAISEDGFFGVKNTTQRIAGFVINGAGDDVERLKKGLEGMKKGFAEAEKMWGKKLPKISQETMQKSIDMVTKRIDELGGHALNTKA